MPVGSCEITLDSKKFTLDGTVDGQPFQNSFPTTMYPTLPLKPGKYFEIQDGQEIYRIMLDNPKQAVKWIAALEYYSKTQKQK